MCIIYKYLHDKSFSEETFFVFFYLCTMNPLCRILPKTGNTPAWIINGLCSDCSHRQWYHFLISWLDEACQWAGSCTHLARQHTGPERMPCLLASPPNYSRTSFESDRAVSPDSSAVWGLRVALAVRLASTRPLTDSPRKLSGSLSTWISEAWEGALVSSRGQTTGCT